jgi:hypothetical protein
LSTSLFDDNHNRKEREREREREKKELDFCIYIFREQIDKKKKLSRKDEHHW